MEPGNLWQSLTEEQQRGVLEALEESEDESTLITFEEFKAKYKEWPLK